MALTFAYPAPSAVDAARLARAKELFAAAVAGLDPDLDLRRGLVSDNVLHPRALLSALTEEAVLDALAATSLAELAADPTLGDEAAVDRALGNYRLTRRAAAKATGGVTILVSAAAPVAVAAGAAFTVGGVEFVADRSYAARTAGTSAEGAGDVPLVAVTGGYVFTVGVVAAAAGSAGNVRYGAAAEPALEPPGFVRAFAAADFAGGADAETNADLVGRLAAGLATRGWSSRPSIEAVMRTYEVVDAATGASTAPFADLAAVSVVGCGDAEMTRDAHTLWPVSAGGRADLYARTTPAYATAVLTKTATLVSKVGAVGTWQVGLGRDDAPGFYEVTKALAAGMAPDAAGFAPSSDVRSKDTSGDGWKPLVPTTTEGAYSRYQTAVVQFADTVTNATALTLGATAPYTLAVKCMPLVADLQDFWNAAERRPPTGDVLVRAPVPCFTEVELTVEVWAGTEVDEDACRAAVADAVNASGFAGRVTASAVSAALHALIPDLVGVSAVAFSGRIRKPSGATLSVSGTDALVAPSAPADNVGARTVAFLATPADVTLTVTTLASPEA